MAEFNAAHVMSEVKERAEQIEQGGKLVPVLAAIIAVCAAIATLFANHSSISGLSTKNEAILAMSQAADQYNYYESKRIKVQLNQALINGGLVTSGPALAAINRQIAHEEKPAKSILSKAQALQRKSDDSYERSETYMQSYEKFEVAATLFEVSVVLVSITALMRSTKVLLFVAGAATLVGLGYFVQGWILH